MRYFILGLLFSVNTLAHGGMFADYTQAYLADGMGKCNTRVEGVKPLKFVNVYGVCFPETVLSDNKNRELIILAVTELINPEQLDRVMKSELLQRQPTEAYRVIIDKQSDNLLTLADGSVVKTDQRAYVGILGYRKQAILYKHGEQWKLCVNRSSFNVDIIKYVKAHYSKSAMQGETVRNIEKMAPCV